MVAAAIAALDLLESHPHRVERLQAAAHALRDELAAEGFAAGGATQIVPLRVGEAEPTMALCERLLEHGIFAQGIRPPTVPDGSSRLRLTVMATHRAGELRHAARVIASCARDLGVSAVPSPRVRASAPLAEAA
jgi:7-keto-8-aminopelargonate synthetase-like enzyme